MCNIPIKENIAKILLAGIVFDTRRFLYTNNQLFDTISFLLGKFPTAYDAILPYFTNSRSKAERIACKAISVKSAKGTSASVKVE